MNAPVSSNSRSNPRSNPPPEPQSSLADWLGWLQTLSPTEIDLGLDRVRSVLRRLELPMPALVVAVGGTNGKGSSVAMLDALLRAGGERTGAYTSPHILDYNERICIDGDMVEDADVVAAFTTVEAVRGDVPLTYFEFGTLAALCVFAERRVDAAILEVGLGGRLDAVNAVDAHASLITNVSLDHSDWLGEDIESIATEKAGILRAGRPAVFGSTEVPRAITARAADIGCDLRLAGRDFGVRGADDGRWIFHGRDTRLEGLDAPPLPGNHQRQNAAAVLALIEAIGRAEILHTVTVNEAFAGISMLGRGQRLEARGRHWLLDGAHNAASAAALADTLAASYPGEEFVAIAGVLDDKDASAIVGALVPAVGRWIATAPDSKRAVTPGSLAATLRSVSDVDIEVRDNVPSAIETAIEMAAPEQPILVTGSFYTVGAALAELGPDLVPDSRAVDRE